MKKSSYKLFFKAICNKTRIKIIELLRKGPRNVSEISRILGFEQSRISHNLKCLENCGFVNIEQNGKQRVYELDKKHIIPILKEIDKHIQSYNKRLISCGVIKK